MAVRMVALNKLKKNGQFLSRKVIPVVVREAYPWVRVDAWECVHRAEPLGSRLNSLPTCA